MSSTPVPSMLTGTAATIVSRAVTSVVFVIASLSFAFGFSNGWTVGIQLGVPAWSAPLVAPAVDLSVVALLASIQFLRAQGTGGRLIGPRLLLGACGLITFALNTARPILDQHYGRACFDAVAPALLIGWGEVGPRLIALLHSSVPFVPDDSQDELTLNSVVQDEHREVPEVAGPPAELVARARQLDATQREATGRPITRDRLRSALGVSNALAGELLHHVRTSVRDGDAV